MAAGKDWTLTEKRLRECLTMLNSQHTVGSIASHYKIARETLSTKLSEAGVDTAGLRNAGKLALRAMAFESIMNIKDPSKRSESALKYLSQYKIIEDVESSNEDDTAIDIRESILNDLHS